MPDEPLRRWDLTRARPPARRAEPTDRRTTMLAASAVDGRPVVLSGGHNEKVYLWDITTGTKLAVEDSGSYHPTGIATGVLDGRPIAVISRWIHSPTVLWRLDSREIVPIPLPDFETVWALDCRDGRLAVITTEHHGSQVRRWDLDTGEPTVIDAGVQTVTAVALGARGDEPVLAVGRIDGHVTLCDPRDGNSLGGPFLMPNPVAALSFHTDGRLAVCFDADIVVLRRLWTAP